MVVAVQCSAEVPYCDDRDHCHKTELTGTRSFTTYMCGRGYIFVFFPTSGFIRLKRISSHHFYNLYFYYNRKLNPNNTSN